MSGLNILSGGAAQGLVAGLAPDFKALTGFDIAGEFGAVGAMADKLRLGTLTDIVILTAAIGNAVFDALGVRVRDLPITRDRLIAAMELSS